MKALVVNQQKKNKIPTSFMQEKLQQLTKKIIAWNKKNKISDQIGQNLESLSVTLVFVEKERMTALNSHYRGIVKPTDILSFKSDDPEIFGELILCPEVIAANAKTNSWTQKDEYLYMLIHGILHLLDFDHENELDAKKMFTIQDQLFNKLTTGPKIQLSE